MKLSTLKDDVSKRAKRAALTIQQRLIDYGLDAKLQHLDNVRAIFNREPCKAIELTLLSDSIAKLRQSLSKASGAPLSSITSLKSIMVTYHGAILAYDEADDMLTHVVDFDADGIFEALKNMGRYVGPETGLPDTIQ